MRYKSFRIRNFKGIKDTTVSLESLSGASVFALVGLNESGKTTVLEAIHSFSPDTSTSKLVSGEDKASVPFTDRVPRHLISEFTGKISVIATLQMTKTDLKQIASFIKRDDKIIIDEENISDELQFERKQKFEGGDYKKNYFLLLTEIRVKTGGQRKWREPTYDEKVKIRDAFYSATPDIAYFPTFVFNFPKTFFLTKRGDSVDFFYRRVFQDILDHDGRGYTIGKDIVRRVHDDELQLSWVPFLSAWSSHGDKAKIQQVMDRASAAVTNLVLGRWNKIFGENVQGKEIVIAYDVVEGEETKRTNPPTKSTSHDVEVSFQIKDGSRRFNVNDRSLGFRWFFAFMLFTQFRVARSSTRPLLFLFDEPASNLHAAAQKRLIDCFPEVATSNHTLMYSTHSHYMIEPRWLEQTFIVTNRADAPLKSMMDDISLDDESLDIKVTNYRTFVNQHPSQTSYFQPILDRLEVVPSRFDIRRKSVILEGRSDYYILRYAIRLLNLDEFPLLPGLGAGTLGALVSIHMGWGLEFLFVLDSDKQGQIERKRYIDDFGLPQSRIYNLGDLDPNLSVIEDVLDTEAKRIISSALNIDNEPSKPKVKRFFQEGLASSNVPDLGNGFRERTSRLLDLMQRALTTS